MSLLPDDVPPMLCTIGTAFDDDAFVFEVKWDGVRALAYVDDGLRLHSRHRRDLAGRYPELQFLASLPAGTLLDGELVVAGKDGKPDFPAILARESARNAAKVAHGVRSHPVSYVAFDLLYERGASLLDRPLRERRDRLAALVAGVGRPQLQCSDGVIGQGRSLFAAVRERGLEGIVGKRLDSRYRPGERSALWRKIKPVQVVHCAILGYEPDGERDFKSLIIATDLDGELRCVGKVGSGLAVADKTRLWSLLQARRRAQPWLAVEMRGCWVEPGLYCSVSFLERTASGSLRAPVFLSLLES